MRPFLKVDSIGGVHLLDFSKFLRTAIFIDHLIAKIYLLKVNNRNTRKILEKVNIKNTRTQ